MDIIATAIVSALTQIGNVVIEDGYNTLKKLLHNKFGRQSDVTEAVSHLTLRHLPGIRLAWIVSSPVLRCQCSDSA